MHSYCIVAGTGLFQKAFVIQNKQATSFDAENLIFLEAGDDPANVAAPNAKHGGQAFLSERNLVFASSVYRRKNSFGGALFYSMCSITSGGLEYLGHCAVSVSCEQIVQRS
jgi:hypothetical protein